MLFDMVHKGIVQRFAVFSQFSVQGKPGIPPCIQSRRNTRFFPYTCTQSAACANRNNTWAVSLLTRVREIKHLLRPVPTFPGSNPSGGLSPRQTVFRPASRSQRRVRGAFHPIPSTPIPGLKPLREGRPLPSL